MRAIAGEASVTAPLIGYHFGSKEGLFAACVEVVMTTTTEDLLVPGDDGRTVVDLVRDFATKHMDFARHYPEALRFILTVVYGPEDSQPRVDLVRYWSPVLLGLVRRFEQALSTGELRPRIHATAPRLARHLMNVVHMEVMASYEKERFADADASLVDLFDEDDEHVRVEDLVAQFFRGAGELRVPHPGEPES